MHVAVVNANKSRKTDQRNLRRGVTGLAKSRISRVQICCLGATDEKIITGACSNNMCQKGNMSVEMHKKFGALVVVHWGLELVTTSDINTFVQSENNDGHFKRWVAVASEGSMW